MATHLAAVSPAKGQPFEIRARNTPKPGPDELLIAVKSVAINPADAIMRDTGLFMETYPAVIGFDVAGLVLEVGSDVPTDLRFQPGVTRIAAYAAHVWKPDSADYGVFQERCLIPWQHVAPLQDNTLSWNHAATLPVAVQVPLSAWDAMGIPRMGSDHGFHAAEQKKEALLVWGASSSVGTMGVQTGKLLKNEANSPFAAVYATAGAANLDYVASLGADRVFDHRDPQVVDAIVCAAKNDGLVIRHCFLGIGELAACQAVLKPFLGDLKEGKTARIVSAPIVPEDAEVLEGMETIFVMPSIVEGKRLQQFQYWIETFLKENLAKGMIRPSPKPKVVGKGLEFINKALDLVAEGVSCTKLVVEVAE